MDRSQLIALLEAQQDAIEQIALSDCLPEILNSICENIESILDTPEAKSSILILEGDQLRHGAAPRLPKAYCEAIDGVTIGPKVGSCGTAAYTKESVFVEDIESDPLWQDFRSVALPHQLKACWSKPIISTNGEVLGTFAIYYGYINSPTKFHLGLIDRFSHLASLAIEKNQSSNREQALVNEIRRSNEKFSRITQVLPDIALVFDSEGTYIDIYGNTKNLVKRNPETLLGKNVRDVLPKESANLVLLAIEKAIEEKCLQVIEYDIQVGDVRRIFEGKATIINHYLPQNPEKKHVLWMARDITEKKDAEAKISQLAFFDPLTSLPNRRLLTDRLQVAIDRASREHLIGALLYIDLDHFKRINDSLGHAIGDRLLEKVAQRLQPVIRRSDTLARVGGDEFVVVLETMGNNEADISSEAGVVAEKLIDALKKEFDIDENVFRVGCSIGISLIMGPSMTANMALSQSDTAMYRAKSMGGNTFAFFDPSLQETLTKRLQLERDILTALDNNQFSTHFQPQIGSNQRLIGAEALVRWQHPDKGFIPPLEFIPIAEQYDLIHKIQNIVLKDCCELLLELQQQSLVCESFTLSINISPIQFNTQKLDKSLLKTLNEFDLSPSNLKLEITEGMLIEDIDFTIEQMNGLIEKGFKFSIDDFGTGYSSLTYLHTFPIDELKIDKSFIDEMLSDKVGTAIVDAIIALSNHLGFKVVAEGVETLEQAELLMNRQIKAMQGYYYAKPMPADTFINWIKELNDI